MARCRSAMGGIEWRSHGIALSGASLARFRGRLKWDITGCVYHSRAPDEGGDPSAFEHARRPLLWQRSNSRLFVTS